MALLTFMGKAASALIHTIFSIITRFIVLRKKQNNFIMSKSFFIFLLFSA